MIATHPVAVVGPLADVRFPNLCAACGTEPPAGDVRLEKMFRRVADESPDTIVFAHVDVPLCRACLDAHARAHVPIDPAVLRRLRRRWAGKALLYALPAAMLVWLLAHLAPLMVRSARALAADPRQWGALVAVGGVLFVLMCLGGIVYAALGEGRPLVAPYDGDHTDAYVETVPAALGGLYVVPGRPTPTLAAVNFLDEEGPLFAPTHRTFTFANADVAARFAEVNAERLWDPASPRVRRAARIEKLAFVAVVVVTLGIVLAQLVGG
jgi:hypothetical protein